MDRWVNKVAVVTGASAGIGEAIAELLVKDGITVVGLARRKERLEELRRRLTGKEGTFHAIKADLTVEEDIISAFQWIETNLGGIHIIINNAGSAVKLGLIEATETDVWRHLYNLNVLALQICSREAIRSMRKHNIDHGHIINISSIVSYVSSPAPGLVPYYASKKAVTTVSEGLRIELGLTKSKIKVSDVSPGKVKTEAFQNAGVKIPENLCFGLEPADVARSVEFILQQPADVLIKDLVVRSLSDTVDNNEAIKNAQKHLVE